MKEHPILFSGEMVRAILEGRKTQTRRVVKPQPPLIANWAYGNPELSSCGFGNTGYGYAHYVGGAFKRFRCPYGQPGDRLWVRETWQLVREQGYNGPETWIEEWPRGKPIPKSWPEGWWLDFRADKDPLGSSWRPSIFMPRWASRITLEVVSVRVERVQAISEGDAKAEGVTPEKRNPYLKDGQILYNEIPARVLFKSIWDSVNAKRGGKKWLVEPWDLWLWGRDEHDDPESIALDVRDPGTIQWRDPEKLGPDYEFRLFRDSQPPNDGYYEVIWRKGGLVEYVYLRRADPTEGEDYVKYDYSWSSNPWVWVVEFRQIK